MVSSDKRCFLALGFDSENQQKIRQAQQQVANYGQPVVSTNFHQTLLFLGQISANQVNELQQACAHMTAQQFDLSYDHFGFWQKPNIIYLAPQDSPDALLTLVQQLSTQVQTLGIPVSDGHYSPHVTLCKKVRQQPTLPLLGNAIAYRADHFALYESRSTTRGVQYIELWRWPLTASNVNITR